MTVTRAQLEAATTDMLADGYSDCFKSLQGFRPRWTPTREELISFWLSYETRFEEESAHEAAVLKRKSEQYGIDFATWSQYYDYKEAQDYQSYLAEKTAKDEADRHLAALRRRFSTEAAVEAWEHGDI